MIKINPIKTNNIIKNCKTISKPLNSSSSFVEKGLITTSIASAISLAALSQVNNHITFKDISKVLVNNGFQKNKEGIYKKDLSNEEKKDIVNRYSRYSNDVKLLYSNGLTKDDIEKFKSFLNIDNKTGRELLKNNFNKTFETFAILNKNGNALEIINKSRENKNIFKLVTNVIKDDIDYTSLNSIEDWKGKAHMGIARAGQKSLRGELTTASSDVHNFINNLNNGMENQILPTDINLYRKEGYGVLKGIKLNETESLGEKMEEISFTRKPEDILKIKEFIEDNEITAIQKGFMSTTIDKDFLSNFTGVTGNDSSNQDIIWTLHPQENTKGIYVEAVNAHGTASKDQEVLLKTDTKIKINNIDFDIKNRIWSIDADISN